MDYEAAATIIEQLIYSSDNDAKIKAELKECMDTWLKDSYFLSCLESVGVDNWPGYGDAQELYASDYDY